MLMRCLAIHLFFGVVTFLLGVASTAVFPLCERSSPVPNMRPVELITPKANESPVQLGSTVLERRVVFDYDPKKFNPRGVYFIIGSKPKGLREFDSLELSVDEDLVSAAVCLETYANNMCNSAYAVSGLVTNRRLTFVASPLSEDDFEYSFDGYFLRGGVVSNAGKNAAVVKGKLSKSKGHVKIAEGEVKFRIEYLGC
jgi:hypothetical protein